MAVIDYRGMKFGSLTAIERIAKSGKGTYWLCLCKCGATTEVRSDNLSRGKISSCGCAKLHGIERFRSERTSEMSAEFLTHLLSLPGKTGAPERSKHWLTWQAARANLQDNTGEK